MYIQRLILLLLHISRAIFYLCRSFVDLFRSRPAPKPITAERRRVPKHLAVIFQYAEQADAQVILESCVRVEEWAREVGVKELSFYDRKGVLQSHQPALLALLPPSPSPFSTPPSRALDIDLPLTPPASSGPSPPSSVDGGSDTETHTPILKSALSAGLRSRQRSAIQQRTETEHQSQGSVHMPPKINVLSWNQSKPLIARAAQTLVLRSRSLLSPGADAQKPSVAGVDSLLKTSFTSPDLLLFHTVRPPSLLSPWSLFPRPLELDGFPPWHMDLSEMYYDPPKSRVGVSSLWTGRWRVDADAVREDAFVHALDSYERAEMRKGR